MPVETPHSSSTQVTSTSYVHRPPRLPPCASRACSTPFSCCEPSRTCFFVSFFDFFQLFCTNSVGGHVGVKGVCDFDVDSIVGVDIDLEFA